MVFFVLINDFIRAAFKELEKTPRDNDVLITFVIGLSKHPGTLLQAK